MRWDIVVSTFILMGCVTTDARADIVAAPNFTAQETQTIVRNELLRDIVQADPWLVRRLLDLIPHSSADRGQPTAVAVDTTTNPDLTASPRDVLGSVEWIGLIKKAKAEKDQRVKAAEPIQSRSAEGTIEMIEMMRQAKLRKETKGVQ